MEDIARAESEGRGPHGVSFTFVRDPAARFLSGVSEIEYYLTVGEPQLFHDMVLKTRAERAAYKPGSTAQNAKDTCIGCSFFNEEVGSFRRAKEFLLDLV